MKSLEILFLRDVLLMKQLFFPNLLNVIVKMNEDDINLFLEAIQEETGIILDKYCHRDNVFVSKGEMAERIKERISVIEEEIRKGT